METKRGRVKIVEVIIAIILLVTLIASWIRSMNTSDELAVALKSTTGIAFRSTAGSISIYLTHDRPIPAPLRSGINTYTIDHLSNKAHPMGRFYWTIRGDLRGFSSRFIFPYWLPIILILVLITWFAVRKQVRAI